MRESNEPSHAERFRFDNEGYLLVEDFLDADHVARLDAVLERVVSLRRAQREAGATQTGITAVEGDSTRIFYILDDDPLFLELLDFPRTMAYVRALLNAKPHHHASDAIVEKGLDRPGMGWHLDGHDNGFRGLGWPIPLLQLKVGYFLSDMTEGGQGNLCVVPGSHRARLEPDPADLANPNLFDGAVELRPRPGTAVFFHNALWHSGGPWTKPGGERRMLYYAYEHPWMVASMEHWSYSKEFYARLSPGRRELLHGFVFDPPERRWG
ncbi:MAG: phytanoyl-CoA dioxygenase family protein [Armatimonadota bacterium]